MDNVIISRLDSIDKRLAAIEKRLDGDSQPQPVQPAASAAKPAPRPLSITEYVIAKNPNDDNQRALVLASYLEIHRSQADFTADELRQTFIDSRFKAPANVSDKIAKLAKKGLLMQVGERNSRKAWRLTASGMTHLEEGFGE